MKLVPYINVYLYFLLIIICVSSCDNPSVKPLEYSIKKDTVIVKSSLAKEIKYRSVPGAEFTMGGIGMYYSVLYKGDRIIDTIDAAFDFSYVGNDSIVYLPVTIWYDKVEGMCGNIKNYLLLSGENRVVLKNFLPYFNDYFSSPVIEKGILYYWGIKIINQDSGYEDLYASKYNFHLATMDTLFLTAHLPEGSDDMSYYSLLHVNKNDLSYLLNYSNEWIIDKKDFIVKSKNKHGVQN